MILKRKYGLILWIGLFVCCGMTTCYKWHFVEEGCHYGNFRINISPEGEESAGILRVTRHRSYHLRLKCNIELHAPEDYGVVVGIRMIGLRVQLDGSCQDYLKIFMHSDSKTLCQAWRDLDEAQSYATSNSDSTLHMLYQTGDDLDNKTMTHHPGFELSFTAFKRISFFNETLPSAKYFECDNGRVIWTGLTCDGHNNCGDRSDEITNDRIDCDSYTVGSMSLVIAGSIMVMFLFTACIATLVWNERKRARSLRKRLGTTSPIIQTPTDT